MNNEEQSRQPGQQTSKEQFYQEIQKTMSKEDQELLQMLENRQKLYLKQQQTLESPSSQVEVGQRRPDQRPITESTTPKINTEVSERERLEQEAKVALEEFIDAFNDLYNNSSITIEKTAEKQGRKLAVGVSKVAEYTNQGVYKFADIVKQFAKTEQIHEDMLGALKKAYGAFAVSSDNDELDDMKTVRAFKLSDILTEDSSKSVPGTHEKKDVPQGGIISFFDSAENTDSTYRANNKVITRERDEEPRKQMIANHNQLNMGFDPELFSIGAQMAAYHIEAGASKFVDYAKKMIEDVGDGVRPYLIAIYEGARSMPEMEDISKQMDSYDVVNSFDVNAIGKEEEKKEPVEEEQASEKVKETIIRPVAISTTLDEELSGREQQTNERNEEAKRRILKWEERNNKKLQDCTEKEWIKAAAEIFALTPWEAEEYLTHLLALRASM